MKTCIILLSHADTEEKEEILYECILSIKKLHLPIILVSHAIISQRNQELCDYFLMDSNNVLYKDSDFFNYELPFDSEYPRYECDFGGIKTKKYLLKKNYQAAVINSITSGVNMANFLGYDYALLWEYDFILNEKSLKNILLLIDKVEIYNYDCVIIKCKIYNKLSVYSVPQIFPVKKLLDYNSKIITTPKEYIDATKFYFCEQWLYQFYDKLNKKFEIDYNNYNFYFPDIQRNLSSSNNANPCFSQLVTGVFIDENDKTNWIYGICNKSNFIINYTCKIIFENIEVYFYSQPMIPNSWFYNKISKTIINEIFKSSKFLLVLEEISYNNNHETFEYKIDNYNFKTFSKINSFVYK